MIYDYHDQNIHASAWKSGKNITIEVFGVTPDKVAELISYLTTNYPPVKYASIFATVVGNSGYYPGYLVFSDGSSTESRYYIPGQKSQNAGSTAVIYSTGTYICQ